MDDSRRQVLQLALDEIVQRISSEEQASGSSAPAPSPAAHPGYCYYIVLHWPGRPGMECQWEGLDPLVWNTLEEQMPGKKHPGSGVVLARADSGLVCYKVWLELKSRICALTIKVVTSSKAPHLFWGMDDLRREVLQRALNEILLRRSFEEQVSGSSAPAPRRFSYYLVVHWPGRPEMECEWQGWEPLAWKILEEQMPGKKFYGSGVVLARVHSPDMCYKAWRELIGKGRALEVKFLK